MNGKAELLNCDGGDCFWEHAILSYDIYIEDGFDWVLGGKLPGDHRTAANYITSFKTRRNLSCFGFCVIRLVYFTIWVFA